MHWALSWVAWGSSSLGSASCSPRLGYDPGPQRSSFASLRKWGGGGGLGRTPLCGVSPALCIVIGVAPCQLYTDYGTDYDEVHAAFAALKPVTVAIVFNSIRRIAEHAFLAPQPGGAPGVFDIRLLLLAVTSAFWWILKVPGRAHHPPCTHVACVCPHLGPLVQAGR